MLPFGLVNALATFQAYINEALSGLLDVFCVVYLDDILIYSQAGKSHEDHIWQVLKRLWQYKLYANLKKCIFSATLIEYLGFIIGTEGVLMDPDHVTTVTEWLQPTSFMEVQQFLGFANFYR